MQRVLLRLTDLAVATAFGRWHHRSLQGVGDRPSLPQSRMNGHWNESCESTPLPNTSPDAIKREEQRPAPVSYHADGLAHWPSPSKAGEYGGWREAVRSCRLGESPRDTANGEIAILPSIRHLLLWCFPSTIVWRVRAVVIDATKRVAQRWAQSHVRQEVRKTVDPSVADCDSSTTVVTEVMAAGVVAPRLHSHPRVVLGHLSPTTSESVRHEIALRQLAFQAATAFSVSGSQRTRRNSQRGAARTAALPKGIPFAWKVNAMKRSESAECSAC